MTFSIHRGLSLRTAFAVGLVVFSPFAVRAAAPVVGNFTGDSVGFTEDGSAVLLDAGSDATVIDGDSPNFGGGNATVSIVANRVSTEDVLAIRNEGTAAGQIGVAVSDVTFGGVVIGSFTGGTGANDLVIGLNGSATPAAVQALVRNLTYNNTNTSSPGTTARTVRVTVDDGSGGGGTSANADVTVTVAAANDAPTLAGGPHVFPFTGEDTTTVVRTVATILASFTENDVDAGAAARGLAVVTTSGTGTWQYSTDGTTWTNFGTVNAASSLLLSNSTQVRYAPLGQNGETATFSFRSWDTTSGAASANGSPSTVSTAGNGGATAFSSGTGAVVLIVIAVNDAPVLVPGAPTLTGIDEDATGNPGQTIASFVGASITDVDSGSVQGVALTSLVAGNGGWEYSTDGGTSWNPVGGISGSAALLLRSADLVRLVPDESNGTSASITYRGWDQTGATTGGQGNKVDTSVNGGSAPFSTASDTASITVTSLNDSPTDIALSFASVNQSAGANATVGTLATTDVDGGDTFTYTLVSGTGSTDNASFNLLGASLRANNAAALGAGSYSVRVRTTDNASAFFEKAFLLTVVDDVSPTIGSVTGPANGSYRAAQNLDFLVTFTEPVTVTGTPALALTIGSTARNAAYISGSGTTALAFRYVVQAGDTDTDGIAASSSLALAGGTIRDAANNNATLTFSAPNTSAVLVDTATPAVTSTTTASGTYKNVFGGYTITADESPVTFGATGLPTGITLNTTSGAITGTPTQSGPFTVTLTATDTAGNVGTATLTLTINQVALTVTGVSASNKVYDGTTAATLTTSGAALSGVASGDTVTLATGGASGLFANATVGTGKTVTVSGLTISGADAGNYLLTQPTTTADITKATATVTLGSLAATYDGAAKSATATTSPSGLTVNLTYDGSATAPTNAGSYSVVGTISDTNYQGSATGTLVIGKASQTVSFAPIGAVTVGTPVALSATASSGLPVTFSIVSGNATIAGSSFTANDANAITVRATQTGNGNYNSASADQTVSSITKKTQTITFPPPAAQLVTSAPVALTATASSGLTVAYAVQSGPAAVAGSVVTLSGAPGIVTIVASQPGDAAYLAAPAVTRTFAVTAPLPLTYFGTVTGGLVTQGDFAAELSVDGSSGRLIGYLYLSGVSEGFVVNFAPDVNGAFVATATPLAVPAATGTWTFHGQISGGTISGTIAELSCSYSGSVEPVGGAMAALSGFYTCAPLGTTTGTIYAIAGTTGPVHVLAVLPGLVIGKSGVVAAATGDFAIAASPTSTISGHIEAASATMTGFIMQTGGATTDFAGVRAGTAHTERLSNLSSRARVGVGDNIAIAGFVIGGTQPKQLLVRAVGPGLIPYDVNAPLANPRIRIVQNGADIAINDDWGAAPNAADIAAAFTRTGAFPLGAGSQDAALLLTLPPGSYTALVDGVGGQGVALAEIYDASDDLPSSSHRLLNISTRAFVGSGDDTLIGGFVVTGNFPKRVLVRGVGPTLARYDVAGALADPKLRIFQGATAIAENDNWGVGANTAAELDAAALAVFAFALNPASTDAALLITLAPGVYTAHVVPATGAPGVALVEVYELP